MLFTDISNFNKVSDYISILNGSLLSDFIIIFGAIYFPQLIKSGLLRNWYKTYGLSAIIVDTLILVIGIIIARAVYNKIFGEEFNIFKFALLVLIIQIIHDFALYFIVIKPLPRGMNNIIDMFKDYANEVSVGAVVGDSIMITMAVFFASLFAGNNTNTNIVILIVLAYILPYIVHAK